MISEISSSVQSPSRDGVSGNRDMKSSVALGARGESHGTLFRPPRAGGFDGATGDAPTRIRRPARGPAPIPAALLPAAVLSPAAVLFPTAAEGDERRRHRRDRCCPRGGRR